MLTSVVRHFCETHQLRNARVLIGVSGGADSVSLLRTFNCLANELVLELVIAHFNHNLRACSTDDALWVQQLADQLQLECEIGSAQLSLKDEATARDARYEFFKQISSKHHCTFLALAHTKDDQAETILHHILRGTGLKGLAGIPETRPLTESVTLVRPLLTTTRADVEAYLKQIEQPYRTDPSNLQTHYTRNFIRHDLLPQLREQLNPQVDDALVRLASQAQETQDTLEQLANRLLREALIEQHPRCVRLQCAVFADQPELLVREAFTMLWRDQNWPRQKMTYGRWQGLASLAISSTSSQLSLPGPIQAVKRRKLLELSLRTDR